MIVNHNISALNAYRRLSVNNISTNKALEKLSSGHRVNRAGDNAAGLAISEKMRGQIRGLEQATRNAQDGISLIQTAEGALNETHAILQRMKELAVQAANDTNTDSDRSEIQKEINQLADEIDRIANTTEFNTQKLLDGSKGFRDKIEGSVTVVENNSSIHEFKPTVTDYDEIDVTATIVITRVDDPKIDTDEASFSVDDPDGIGARLDSVTKLVIGDLVVKLPDLRGMKKDESINLSFRKMEVERENALSMQIGANSGQNMLIEINDMGATAMGIRKASTGEVVDIATAGKATVALAPINNAIELVSAERSKLGAYQNRLEHTINNLGTSSENLTDAESRIRDVDMAKEMMEFTKNTILSQAAQAMLAQANQQPQGVLQLLQ